MNCPFCERIEAGDVVEANELAAAFPDGYPLTDGHTLIIPLRHEPDFFKLTEAEQAAVMGLVRTVQQRLVDAGGADGFNVGINIGDAAGQTVGHAHVPIIPRTAGDVPDPRGGIRWMIPERAAYWKE